MDPYFKDLFFSSIGQVLDSLDSYPHEVNVANAEGSELQPINIDAEMKRYFDKFPEGGMFLKAMKVPKDAPEDEKRDKFWVFTQKQLNMMTKEKKADLGKLGTSKPGLGLSGAGSGKRADSDIEEEKREFKESKERSDTLKRSHERSSNPAGAKMMKGVIEGGQEHKYRKVDPKQLVINEGQSTPFDSLGYANLAIDEASFLKPNPSPEDETNQGISSKFRPNDKIPRRLVYSGANEMFMDQRREQARHQHHSHGKEFVSDNPSEPKANYTPFSYGYNPELDAQFKRESSVKKPLNIKFNKKKFSKKTRTSKSRSRKSSSKSNKSQSRSKSRSSKQDEPKQNYSPEYGPPRSRDSSSHSDSVHLPRKTESRSEKLFPPTPQTIERWNNCQLYRRRLENLLSGVAENISRDANLFQFLAKSIEQEKLNWEKDRQQANESMEYWMDILAKQQEKRRATIQKMEMLEQEIQFLAHNVQTDDEI